MPSVERRALDLLPQSLRKPLRNLQTAHSVGLLSHPIDLLQQVVHRRATAKLQKSLLYHRYATAVLLSHELGLYDALRQEPMTDRQLAERLSINRRAADAMLRIVESMGHIRRTGGGRYRLTSYARNYLTADGHFSVAPMLDLMAAQAAAFGDVPAGMKNGQTPRSLDIFSAGSRYKSFLGAVNGYLHWAAADLLWQIDLPQVEHFIAGSMGVSFSGRLLQHVSTSRVTFGCLDHLVREIPTLCDQYAVPPERIDGMHAHGGDPSNDRWGDENFDLVFLTKKMILDPDNRIGEKFAGKAYQVLRPGGVAIFWETIYSDSSRTPLPTAMEGVLDLGASPIGTVNTEKGIRKLLRGIGYRHVEVVPALAGQTTFVVGYKPRKRASK